MSSVNKVMVLGRLGRDPEVKYTQSGAAICNITLATSRSWKDKQSGEKVEETEWHRVVLFERLAEVAGEYLAKGLRAHIEGRLRTRKWTDKDGIERYTTEIYADSLQLLDSKPEGGRRDDGGQQDRGRPSAPSERQRQAPPQRQQQPRSGTGFDDMDSDIPF